MTPLMLLRRLGAFLQRETADLLLPADVDPEGAGRKVRAPKVFYMDLPELTGRDAPAPYVLLQFLKETDAQKQGEKPACTGMVRLVFCVWGEDRSAGGMDLLNLITRVRTALLRAGQVGNQFILWPSLEWMIYTEDTAPFFLGEMMTVWDLPPVESEACFYE